MARSRPRVRKPTVRSRFVSPKSGDRPAMLTPEELLRAEHMPATVTVPEFRETVDYQFSIGGTTEPKIRVTMSPKEIAGDSGSFALSVSAKGCLEEVAPCVARGQRIGRRTRSTRAAGVNVTRSLRPPWLDQVYVPKTLPMKASNKRWTLDAPMKPLVQYLVDREYPWCAIGRLEVKRRGQDPKFGSGVLVGPNLLLTASHLMPWDTDDSSVRFMPAFRGVNDSRFGHAYVDRYRGIPYEFDNDANVTDYVICKLNWRIGDRTGWLGSQYWSDEDRYHDGLWFSAGYPLIPFGTFLPASELWIAVEDIDNDANGLEIETDNFTSDGWSGGPLWGWIDNQPRVIGICSGMDWDWPDPKRSVFAGGRLMVELVLHGHANWV